MTQSQLSKNHVVGDLTKLLDDLGFSRIDPSSCEWMLELYGYDRIANYAGLFEPGSYDGVPSLGRLSSAISLDRAFRTLVIEYTGIFELKLRTQYSKCLDLECGPLAHLDSENFRNRDFHAEAMGRYEDECAKSIKRADRTDDAILAKVEGTPVWAAVNMMTLGTLSMLYSNTESRTVRERTADAFGATPKELSSWSQAISDMRNSCAHFKMLLGTRLASIPRKIPGISGDNGTPFYAALALARLLSRALGDVVPENEPDGSSFPNGISDLFKDHEDVLPIFKIPGDWCDQINSVKSS